MLIILFPTASDNATPQSHEIDCLVFSEISSIYPFGHTACRRNTSGLLFSSFHHNMESDTLIWNKLFLMWSPKQSHQHLSCKCQTVFTVSRHHPKRPSVSLPPQPSGCTQPQVIHTLWQGSGMTSARQKATDSIDHMVEIKDKCWEGDLALGPRG